MPLVVSYPGPQVRCAGVVAHWPIDHAGPLTRTVADAAHLLNELAGYDANDPACQDQPVPDYTKALGRPIKGLRRDAMPWMQAPAVGP